MKKNTKILFLSFAILFFCINTADAKDLYNSNLINIIQAKRAHKTQTTSPTQLSQPTQQEQPTQPAQKDSTASPTALTPTASPTATPIVEVSNKPQPKLVTPVVEDPRHKKHEITSKKIDLKAVVFDPDADFKAQAEEEGREMTRLEAAEYNLHESLHGEVCKSKDIPRVGLLATKTLMKPERGIIDSMVPWFNYKGGLSDNWAGANYTNTLFPTDSMTIGMDGKFKNKKTVFRLMGNLGMSKEGHTFFNDFWGDNYIMHYFTPRDQVLLGYSRNANGIEGGISPFSLPFFARSQIAKNYGNVRALGAKAQGQHKLYDYNFGVFSSGRNFVDWFPGGEFDGLFAIKPLGLTNGKYGDLSIGGGLNSGNAESYYTVGNAFVDYEYKRWNLTCEYGSADRSNGSTGFSMNQSEGYNGTLAYRITPKLQALVRYDKFDPNKNKSNDMRTEYTVGFNYFVKGQALKLILNYVYYTVENGTYGSQIITGAQIVL